MSGLKTEVVIVGAGPVGLVAACMLQHYGIDFIIFDKKEEPVQTSNALLINMRTLQLLDCLGISGQFIAEGLHIDGMDLYASKKRLAQVDVDNNLPYSFVLTLPQAKTEAILIRYLQGKGIEVRRGWELSTYQQNDSQVELTVAAGQSKLDISASTLLACDGYKSTVRQLSKIDYPGDELASHFVMIDAKWHSSEPALHLRTFSQRDLTMAIIPYAQDGRARFIAEVSRCARHRFIDLPTLNDMQAIAAACVPFDHEITDLSWSSKFWVHEHLAAQYRLGRVFLAGDAAHVHSPAGGMGMNTGMQDVINWCWKLNMSRRQHKIDWLDGYASERQLVGRKVIARSSMMTRAMLISNPVVYYLRGLLLRLLLSAKKSGRRLLKTMNQLDMSYVKNNITASGGLATLTAGSAMPDFILPGEHNAFHFYRDRDPACFYMLCFGKLDADSGLEQVSSLLAQNNAPLLKFLAAGIEFKDKSIHCPHLGFVVIRPDGYIALSTRSADKVESYFKAIF